MSKTTLVLLAAAVLAACGSRSGASRARVYNASASVGDFLILSVHPERQTIDVDNRTTGETGTVAYAIDSAGRYLISTDRTLVAYELPGFALVMEGRKAGSNGDEPTLIVGLEKAPISLADFEGRSFNTMQFRTTEGGVEIGHGAFGPSGDLTFTNYQPAAAAPGSGDRVFSTFVVPASAWSPDTGTGTLRIAGDDPKTMFGTPSGGAAIDTAAGSLFLFPAASSKDFDSSVAGTYDLMLYGRHDVTVDPVTGLENGKAEMSKGTVSITSGVDGKGRIEVMAEDGTQMLPPTDLTPLADTDFYDPSGQTGLADPSYGLFLFRTPDGATVFVSFLDRGLAMASYSRGTVGGASVYGYVYGFAIQNPSPGLGFIYEDPSQLSGDLACYGVFPWDPPANTEIHPGIDLYARTDDLSAGEVRRVRIVAPADGTAYYAQDGVTGHGTSSVAVMLEMNAYWYLIFVFEPQSSDGGVLDLQHASFFPFDLASVKCPAGAWCRFPRAIRRGDPIGDLIATGGSHPNFPSVHLSIFYKAPGQDLEDVMNDFIHVPRNEGSDLPPVSGLGSPFDPAVLAGTPTTIYCPYVYSSPLARSVMDRLPRKKAAELCSCVCAYGSQNGSCGVCPMP